ncbi:hypothetical protein GGS24DRAFT_461764 [Hypoxylon argillaceum]|nr:hypothetical protein GGS24DRAFT_461764 [Hypoxylon argillaceum]
MPVSLLFVLFAVARELLSALGKGTRYLATQCPSTPIQGRLLSCVFLTVIPPSASANNKPQPWNSNARISL